MQSTWTALRILCALGLCTVAAQAHAQSYPARPIRLIVPFAPGGASDIVARIVQPGLAASLGQQVVIDNRSGAAGSIGTALGAVAQPDGYTLVLVPSSHAINQTLYEKLPFHSLKSFAPIILLDTAPFLLAVHPSLPVKSVADLIRLAKTKNAELRYPSGGIGSGSHLAGELFAAMADVEILHVPYKGIGPSLVDLVAGRTQLVFSPPLPVMPHVKSGKLTAIAHTGPRRAAQLPNVPPVAETVPGYQAISWHGVLAPARTPPAIIGRINSAIAAILGNPEIAKGLAEQGLEPGGGSPDEFARFIASDIERLEKLIRRPGISAGNL